MLNRVGKGKEIIKILEVLSQLSLNNQLKKPYIL